MIGKSYLICDILQCLIVCLSISISILHMCYIYINYTDRQRSSTYTKEKRKKNNYSGQGNLELILYSSQLLNLRIIQSGCKNRFINVEREIRLNKFT